MKYYFLFFAFTIVFYSSCSNKEMEAEVLALKTQVKEDSIFQSNWEKESTELDALLTQITKISDEAQFSGEESLAEKATVIEELMTKANAKIATLESEVKVQETKARQVSYYRRNLASQKQKTLEQDSLIKYLTQQVKDGERLTEQLDEMIDIKDKTIEEQVVIINDKVEAINKKNIDLAQKAQELNLTKQKAAKDLELQKNKLYVDAGLDRIAIVRLAPGMALKKKKKIVEDAWDFFCKAHKNGHYNALTEMSNLELDKKLGKFVAGRVCE